jgi:uncharacterized BrkB/YihY/UPF0761 family membrane protein
VNESEIESKRRFWRRVLAAGILVLILALLMMVSLYLSGMADVKTKAGLSSEIEQEIAVISARKQLLVSAAVWTLPFAILASLMMNVARYKLRKLKKLKNSEDSTH